MRKPSICGETRTSRSAISEPVTRMVSTKGMRATGTTLTVGPPPLSDCGASAALTGAVSAQTISPASKAQTCLPRECTEFSRIIVNLSPQTHCSLARLRPA